MRIIHVVNVRWFNATAWYGIELARLMQAAGHEVLVLGLPDTDPLARAAALNLPIQALPLNARSPLALPSLLASMHRVVHTFRPDVVNCHRGESFVFWGLLKQAGCRFTLVRTRGDQRLPKANLPNRWLHAHVADAVIATNTRMADHFRTALRIPPQHLHTILGGVDTTRFCSNPLGRARIRAAWNIPDSSLVFGLLGRFDRVKGQRECIHAFASLVRAGFDVRLVLLGFPTATTQAEVVAWITEAGLDDRHVLITGKVDAVPACLSALDVGVISSLWSETIARAALELMACSRPLISTSVGVMPDLLPADALCPPGDVTALAALMQSSLNPDFRAALAADHARRMPHLSSDAFLQATLAVYCGCKE